MKKLTALVCVFLLIAVVMAPVYALDYSLLDELTASELMDLRDEIDDRLGFNDLDEGEVDPDLGTRTKPVKVGEKMTYTSDSYSDESVVAFRMKYAIRGEAANNIVKSFSRYNTREMEKDEEWFLVMFTMEALESETDRVDLKDYNFHFVNATGVEYERSYLSDNPKEVSALYVGATQDAWICGRVKMNDTPLINYNDYYGTVWFDPNESIEIAPEDVDLEALGFEPMDIKSKGDMVTELQYVLMARGLLKTAPTGKYDLDTVTAVRKFQKAFELEDTSGTADEETLRLLLSSVEMP